MSLSLDGERISGNDVRTQNSMIFLVAIDCCSHGVNGRCKYCKEFTRSCWSR